MKSVSLAGFAAALRTAAGAMHAAERHGLEVGAKLIEHEAKSLIGTEYPAWPALADSTVREKAAKGQTGRVSATDPLLATGEMRATIGHQVENRTALIGTPDPVAVFHEYGTERMPARPVFQPAGFRQGEAAANAIGKAVAHTLAGMRPDK